MQLLQQPEPLTSLCDVAYEDLGKENPELVKKFESILVSEPELAHVKDLDGDPLKRQKQMSDLVAKKLAIMTAKQWRISLLGKSIETREQFDRIVKLALVAKDFISPAASMDPIHAGLPWAGVCVLLLVSNLDFLHLSLLRILMALLQLLVNETQQRKAAIDGLEYISKLIRRYTLIEGIYLQDNTLALEDELKLQIRKLYKQILEYEAKTVCQFDRNAAYQTVRNVSGVDKWKDMLESVKATEHACEQLMQSINASNQQRSLQKLDQILEQQEQKIEELWVRLLQEMETTREEQKDWRLEDQMAKCLQTFRTSDYEDFKARNPDPVEGTCRWVLDHQNYHHWRSSDETKVLWVSADPGCGKSVLSKFLVEELSNGFNTICYFFFKDDNEVQRHAHSALCALLHQLFLCKPSLLKYAQPAVDQNGEKIQQLFGVLWNLLTTAAASEENSSGHVICILDALDECEEMSRFRLIDTLTNYCLSRNGSGSIDCRIKFLVTSRPYYNIESRFHKLTQNLPTIRLSGEQETGSISREIDLVIKAEVKELGSSLQLGESTQSYLENKLLTTTNRTYLWWRLIREEIRSALASTKNRLKQVIDTLPESLDAAYTALLAQIKNQKEARHLLHIVVAAVRPLTLTELNIALNINVDCQSYEDLDLEPQDLFRTRIRALCGLFIHVFDSKIYLIHQTAKEFLTSHQSNIQSMNRVGSDSACWKH